MFVRHSYGHRAIIAYLLNLDSYLYSIYDICFGNKHNLRMYIQVQHISPNPSKVSSKNRGALLPPGEMKCLACQKLYFSQCVLKNAYIQQEVKMNHKIVSNVKTREGFFSFGLPCLKKAFLGFLFFIHLFFILCACSMFQCAKLCVREFPCW